MYGYTFEIDSERCLAMTEKGHLHGGDNLQEIVTNLVTAPKELSDTLKGYNVTVIEFPDMETLKNRITTANPDGDAIKIDGTDLMGIMIKSIEFPTIFKLATDNIEDVVFPELTVEEKIPSATNDIGEAQE